MRNQFGGDPHFNNVSLLLPLRGHLRDESKVPKTVTVSGGVVIVGDAAYFDGAGDYLSVIPLLSASDFTIECWIRPTDLSGNCTLFSQYNSSDSTRTIFDIRSGALSIFNGTNGVVSGATVAANVWSHVAFSRVGGTVRGYLNGVLAVTHSSFGSPGNRDFWVGSYNLSAGADDFVGYIRNVRVSLGIARYTSNFTPSAMLPTHGVLSGKLLLPPFLASTVSLISGTSDALGADDVAAVAALLRSSGALDAANAVDLAAIAGEILAAAVREGTIDSAGTVDAAAFAAKIVAYGGLSASLVDDAIAVVTKITATGTVDAVLSDDELVVLGKLWPSIYRAATGITLSSPESTLALSDVTTAVGSFPPIVITDITLP